MAKMSLLRKKIIKEAVKDFFGEGCPKEDKPIIKRVIEGLLKKEWVLTGKKKIFVGWFSKTCKTKFIGQIWAVLPKFVRKKKTMSPKMIFLSFKAYV